MRVIADLHIHSRYSRATSASMNLQEISHYGGIKGLNLIGSGDFTHPRWLEELREGLEEVDTTGIYRLKARQSNVFFIITTEVSTIFTLKEATRKIHHVIFTPNIDVATQINDRLKSYGALEADGRPTLSLSAAELVEVLHQVSGDNFIFPAHAWTPWFSVFGSKNGFNNIVECYQDEADKIYALETGLSSDPPMNWRVSALDKYTLVSNSDAHSAWPWRLGREANVLEIDDFSYPTLIQALKRKEKNVFKFTVETPPQYGKYHWTGHRGCGVSMPPTEAIDNKNICPECRKRMVEGVEQRVEELSDRPPGLRPENTVDYINTLPLSEVIATVLKMDSPSSKRVWGEYNSLVSRFGSEFNVLLDADIKEIADASSAAIATAIDVIRSKRLRIVPGYDGVYGRLTFNESEKKNEDRGLKEGLWRFM